MQAMYEREWDEAQRWLPDVELVADREGRPSVKTPNGLQAWYDFEPTDVDRDWAGWAEL